MSEHFVHETTAGERWDLIAWRYYRDVRRQSAVIAANRHVFVDPESGRIGRVPAVLPGGLSLAIPVIEEARDERRLPPWKRGQPAPPASGRPVRRAVGP